MNGLDKLVDNLSHGRFGILLATGYPNIDLIAPLEADALPSQNPGLSLDDYVAVDKGSVVLRGRGVSLSNSKTIYLKHPGAMKSPEGSMEQRLLSGTKYSSEDPFTSEAPEAYLTVPVQRVELGGGISKSLQAIHDLLGHTKSYSDKIYSLTQVGPDEQEVIAELKKVSNAILIAQDIDPRINWVVPYGTLANGDKAFSDRIIIKHPFKELSIDPNQYESHIAAKLSKDHDPKTAVDTIFINGTKSRTDIRNAIDYSMERKGVPHIVAVVTDTTAKLGEIVKHDLLNRATYISNNDELGLLVGESCSKKDDGAYVIKLEDTLHAIRKLRELQRTGNRLNGTDNPYQNIYVTLGQYGSISVDKQGNISWVGSYQAAWISSPDSTGFGDAFAAGIALAENVDRNISPVYAQIFASALVASKLKDPNYRVAKPGDIKRMINYNDIAIVGLGQFDENNNLGNLRQKRISRLDTLFRTSSLVYGR